MSTCIATIPGYPRIGPQRELKRALEGYWSGRGEAAELLDTARQLRQAGWWAQLAAGLDEVPVADDALYDQVLDAALMVGAVPERAGGEGATIDHDLAFRLARGRARAGDTGELRPLAMTKWFGTNYHHLVPEYAAEQRFRLAWNKPLERWREARALEVSARPVVLGPLTLLRLGRCAQGGDPLALLTRLLPVYAELLAELVAAGATRIQVDEPILVLDRDLELDRAASTVLAELASAAAGAEVIVHTPYGGIAHRGELLASAPVTWWPDLAAAPDELVDLLALLPDQRPLIAGVIDGRSPWRGDLAGLLGRLAPVGARLQGVGAGCSLLHLPYELERERELPAPLRGALAFVGEKLGEVATLARGLRSGVEAVSAELGAARAGRAARRAAADTELAAVRQRQAAVGEDQRRRATPFAERYPRQCAALGLPPLPSTTIGSFPQTAAIRSARAAHRRGELAAAGYRAAMESEIEACIRRQEEIGLDVLVHGEAERTDMVEYFAAGLGGVVTTSAGWVQSYGSRCVRPPIIAGDVVRERQLSVDWTRFARECGTRPLKGMLTGPITILQWSFVREDLPRAAVAEQLALALRDEVAALEAAGVGIIQVDEPALREGLPLRASGRAAYLRWAVDAFRLATGGVGAETQIHTHMCYARFADLGPAIAELDADVISLETARGGDAAIRALAESGYPNAIGPGVYDVHAPRVPTVAELADLLRAAVAAFGLERVWANPDCGLKTRGWEEVEPALRNLVAAARQVRAEAGAAIGSG